MPLLHRHYKIARTETRCHLLLKIRQMATQTSASRDYVLFSSGKSATRKFLNCLMICGHSPWSAPNLERHGSSRMPDAVWLEIPDFVIRIPPVAASATPPVLLFSIQPSGMMSLPSRLCGGYRFFGQRGTAVATTSSSGTVTQLPLRAAPHSSRTPYRFRHSVSHNPDRLQVCSRRLPL